MINKEMADLRTIKPRSHWDIIDRIFIEIYAHERIDHLNGVVNLPDYLLN